MATVARMSEYQEKMVTLVNNSEAIVGNEEFTEDFILTTRKIATSREAYEAAVTFDGTISAQLSADAGWTLLDVAST